MILGLTSDSGTLYALQVYTFQYKISISVYFSLQHDDAFLISFLGLLPPRFKSILGTVRTGVVDRAVSRIPWLYIYLK